MQRTFSLRLAFLCLTLVSIGLSFAQLTVDRSFVRSGWARLALLIAAGCLTLLFGCISKQLHGKNGILRYAYLTTCCVFSFLVVTGPVFTVFALASHSFETLSWWMVFWGELGRL
jgi:hypothetical protein